jgi:hypothetical protein
LGFRVKGLGFKVKPVWVNCVNCCYSVSFILPAASGHLNLNDCKVYGVPLTLKGSTTVVYAVVWRQIPWFDLSGHIQRCDWLTKTS